MDKEVNWPGDIPGLVDDHRNHPVVYINVPRDSHVQSNACGRTAGKKLAVKNPK